MVAGKNINNVVVDNYWCNGSFTSGVSRQITVKDREEAGIMLQHYVPRFYLKYFAIPETKTSMKPKVWAFSKEKDGKAPFVTGVHGIAAQRYLYSPIKSDGSRCMETETKLAGLESILSQVWEQLANDFVDLDNIYIRKALALFLATLVLRNPQKIDEIKKIHQTIVNWVETMPTEELTPELLVEFNRYKSASENNFQEFFVEHIHNDALLITRLFLAKRWSIIFSNEPVFITSDNPVVIVNDKHKPYGIKTEGTVIIFPISPTKLLWLDDLYDEPKDQYYPLKCQDARSYNMLIWMNAPRYMFSHRDCDVVLAEIMSYVDAYENEFR